MVSSAHVVLHEDSSLLKELTLAMETCTDSKELVGLRLRRGEAFFKVGGRDLEAIEDLTCCLEEKEATSRAFYLRASAYNRLGDFSKAIDDYQRALDMDAGSEARSPAPRRSVALGAEAYARLREEELRSEMSHNPMKTSSAAAHARGVELRRRGDFQKAVEAYSEALAMDSSNFRCYFDRAFARDAMGDVRGAVDDYTEAVSLEPAAALAWYNRGIARSRLGDARGAAMDFGEAIQRAEKQHVLQDDDVNKKDQGVLKDQQQQPVADFYHNRAYCRREIGDLAGAIADYDAALARASGRHFKSLYHRAFCLDALGDSEAALRDYEEAVLLEPSHAAAHHNRGIVLEKLRRPREALASFDQALVVARNNRNTKNDKKKDSLDDNEMSDSDEECVAAALYARALVLERLGRPKDALTSLEDAVHERPEDPEFHHALGAHFRRRGDHESAVRAFSAALSLDDDRLQENDQNKSRCSWRRRHALANRAYSSRKLGDFDAAISDYTDAIGLGEHRLTTQRSDAQTDETRTDTAVVVVKLRNARAYCFARSDQTLRAIDDYSAALRLDATNAHALHNRGIMYDRIHDNERAMADFAKVLELEEKHQRSTGDSSAAAILRQTKLQLALTSSPSPTSLLHSSEAPTNAAA